MPGRIIAGGDIRQLTIGGRAVTVAPESSIKLSIGGKTNEAKIAGDSTLVVTQKARLAGFADCTIVNDPESQTLEYLQGLADDATETSVVMTLSNGTIYGGKLVVLGELEADTGEGSIPLEMRGSKFEQI